MIKNTFVACLLFLTTNICVANDRIELYVGEVEILKLGEIERIAIGDPAVVSNSLTNNGQLLLLAESAGTSSFHIWFKNGDEKEYSIHVIEAPNNLLTRKAEVVHLLSDVEGLEINIVGDRIVLSGLVPFGHEDKILRVTETYSEIVDNINFAINTLVRKRSEIESLLSDIPNLDVRIVGERIAITGEIDESYEEAITTVVGAFAEAMDLTQKGNAIDMLSPTNKMVLMNIKITEFNKNYSDTLGISWQNQIAGPSAAFALDGATNPVFRTPLTTSTATLAGNPTGLTPSNAASALGYFGIAAEITSRINLAVSSGNAVILAEPRLAARSGGEATFLAGGEFPIEISNINGTTVEFKQFGIQLNVKPTVDRYNNVRANVETELSAVDQSVAVNGIPGLITRKTTADVILSSGETLVMSGLINQEFSKDTSGLKFLSEIPILGALFRSKTFRDRKSELVIFVTPSVFDSSSDINKKAIEYAKEGIKSSIEAIDEDALNIVY
jgi:pilus assembly protein CpaC